MIHVNDKTGDTGTCHAKRGKCPYGGVTGLDNHYETKEAAQAAAEKLMEERFNVLSNVSSKNKTQKIKKLFKNVQEITENFKPETKFTKNYKDLSTKLTELEKLKEEHAHEVSISTGLFADEHEYEDNYHYIGKLEKSIKEINQTISDLRKNVQNQVLADEKFLNITKNDKSMTTYKKRKEVSERLKEFAMNNPSEWKTGQKQANRLTKRDIRPEYIDSIDKKHITSQNAGSKFTDPRIKKAEDVLVLSLAQRGNFKGDDREKLIKAGASPEAFLPPESGVRYLQINTSGTEALKDTAEMKDSDVLTIVAKGRNDGKPSSLSFSTEVKEQPTTDYATVIIGPDMDDNKKPIPNTEVLWTMHPGTPTRGIRSETIRENGLDDGDKITVGELRKRFGKDIKVNTKLVS